MAQDNKLPQEKEILQGEDLEYALEAVLFGFGEPVDSARLCDCLETDDFNLTLALNSLQARLERAGGVELWQADGKYQLVTKPRFAPQLKKALDIHRDIPLSPAGFEVLSVIAYRQPVTRAYVEQTRGVDCGGVIATLIQRGLVEEKGRLELPGRPLLYGTTDLFLRCFGIADLQQLPDLANIEVQAGVTPKPVSDDGEQLALVSEQEQ